MQLGKVEPRLELLVDEISDSPSLRRFLFEVLPLLVTNSMDHGIEFKAERIKHGKPEQGLLNLKVQAEADQIRIHFEDDGQGLHIENIRRKLPHAHGSTAADLAAFIFTPGFSTRDVVSPLSGRGVGLDAVATHTQESRGQIHIVSYQPFGLSILLPRMSILREPPS